MFCNPVLGIGTSGPWVVHCSDGRGRSGTFIAIDVIISHLDKSAGKPQIDIKLFLEKLRKKRALMVQTEEQFIIIYQAVQEYFRAGNRNKYAPRSDT